MKSDVLFWFYKDFHICKERLNRLIRLNKGVRIFALYGGPLAEANVAKDALSELVDDFYVYPEEKESRWKWEHGDQLICSWYKDRGVNLEWETIFIMQWDMLIADSLENLFSGLGPNEILLSGFTPISEISSWWHWAKKKQSDIEEFKKWLSIKYDYDGELFACQFIIACIPRSFLKKYVDSGNPEIGFLEYKIPTMAVLFGIPICKNNNFRTWWKGNPAHKNMPKSQQILNAVGKEVPFSVILKELMNTNGKRLFHPVFRLVPTWMDNPRTLHFLSYTRLIIVIESYYMIIEAAGDLHVYLKKVLKYFLKRLTRFVNTG